MLTRFTAVVAAAAAMFGLVGAADVPDDPYVWLEEIEGPRALEWARAENARSLGILEKDPRFATLREEARTILTSPSRLPLGEIHRGAVYNFWQDETHVRGVWRRASVESYRQGQARVGNADRLRPAGQGREGELGRRSDRLSRTGASALHGRAVARRRRHLDVARIRHDDTPLRARRVRAAGSQVQPRLVRRRHARGRHGLGRAFADDIRLCAHA